MKNLSARKANKHGPAVIVQQVGPNFVITWRRRFLAEHGELEIKLMRQKQITSISMMTVMATTILGALEQLAQAIGLHHVTKAIFEEALNELQAARHNLDAGKVDLSARRATLKSLTQSARAFATKVRDMLKITMGKEPSALWESAGFRRSFAIPYTPDELQPLLLSILNFLGNQPALEVEQLGITATQAEILYNALVEAQLLVKAQLGVVVQLTQVRDQKAELVQALIRDLLAELKIKLDPMDGAWLKFGFNKPGAIQTPAVPENGTASLVEGNKVMVDWDAAARADYHRVWVKVNGVDEQLKPIGRAKDRDFMIEEVPTNAVLEVAVSAVNDGGESGRSNVVTVITTSKPEPNVADERRSNGIAKNEKPDPGQSPLSSADLSGHRLSFGSGGREEA